MLRSTNSSLLFCLISFSLFFILELTFFLFGWSFFLFSSFYIFSFLSLVTSISSYLFSYCLLSIIIFFFFLYFYANPILLFTLILVFDPSTFSKEGFSRYMLSVHLLSHILLSSHFTSSIFTWHLCFVIDSVLLPIRLLGFSLVDLSRVYFAHHPIFDKFLDLSYLT